MVQGGGRATVAAARFFAADGRPLRAKADISLKQWDDDEKHPLQNPPSHTDSLHSIHSVLPGQTLDRIASRFYGDPARWRLIAEHNDVENPLDPCWNSVGHP